MSQIPLGAKGSFKLLVQPEHLANRFKDTILPPVFATPMMIMVKGCGKLPSTSRRAAIRQTSPPSTIITAPCNRMVQRCLVNPVAARRAKPALTEC